MTLRNTLVSSVLSSLGLEQSDEANLTIQIFTSKRCTFSKVAIGQAQDVVARLNYKNRSIRVVESPVDDNPSLLEDLKIVALPMTVVNDYYLVGVPSSGELESIIRNILES
ncbi:MAG: hypothetical protein P1Q69_13710 [Candidatus Thorarchaeota archaeon]|nr:hypothetical protein [Candidatus Thorarchaeota archaeon]